MPPFHLPFFNKIRYNSRYPLYLKEQLILFAQNLRTSLYHFMPVPPTDSLQHIINSNSTEFGAKCVDELFQLNLPPHSTSYQSDLCGNPGNTHCTIASNVENESNDQIILGDHPTQHIISWITKTCSKTPYNTKYWLDLFGLSFFSTSITQYACLAL